MKLFNSNGKSAPIPSGALLVVDSWENDGDNCQTKVKHFDNAAEAKMHLRITKAFGKQYGNESDINIFALDVSQVDRDVLEYINSRVQESDPFIGFLEILDDPDSEVHEHALSMLIEEMREIASEMLGSSEYYACRVFDGGCVYALPDGINLSAIEVSGPY